MQRDRADAEALQLAGHVAAPVAAVEPLEPVGDRLRGLRRGRRVAARPLAQRRGVVPEIDAAVMDAGIEDGKLEQAPCGGRHRSGGIARRGLAVDVRVQVDEEQTRRRAPRRPCVCSARRCRRTAPQCTGRRSAAGAPERVGSETAVARARAPCRSACAFRVQARSARARRSREWQRASIGALG